MGADEFTQRLHGMTAEDIERVAALIRTDLETPDGEVAWWRATVELSGALKRMRQNRQAGLAAHRAATAVVDAARAAGVEGRDAVTAVARAAAEAARVLLAEGAGAVAPAAVAPLLRPWQQLAAA